MSGFSEHVGHADIAEQATENRETPASVSLHLLSKELEDAANEFLLKISELEKLLPLIEE